MIAMNKTILKGYLFVILSAVIYGCMPLMAKYIYADGANSLTLVFLRNLMALPGLALLARMEGQSLKIPLRTVGKVSVISFFGCTITPILLFSSYNYMASGTATVFHFIYPAVVVLCGILFFKKKATSISILSIVVCSIGIALFYDPNESISFTGSAFALGSGLTFAAYVLLLSNFKNRQVSGFLFSFYVAAASTVLTFVICLVSGQLAFPTTFPGWGLCLLFAISVTMCAVYLFQQGTFLIGGEKTSILSTLEPITSIVIGVAVFHESISTTTVIGSVLVITASILIAISDIKNKVS